MPINSPRLTGLQAAQSSAGGVDEADTAFEHGFTQLAYNVLSSRMPDLMQDVVTFKVLTADVSSGNAVGAFIVMRGNIPLYVPVIMADNQIKPLEVFYNKNLNIFLPLTKEWLSETEKNSLDELGQGIKTPNSLYTDVDIRNITVPPITGRFSYAALEADVEKVFEEAQKEKTAHTELNFLNFLAKTPNAVKTAFLSLLEKNKSLLKKTAQLYGVRALGEALALTEDKTAASQLSGGALWIADRDTKPSEFKRVFGDRSPEAYATLLNKGYVAKDLRNPKNHTVQVQPYSKAEVITKPGVYLLHTVDGEEKAALVIPNPTRVSEGNSTKYTKKREANPGRNPKRHQVEEAHRLDSESPNMHPYDYLVIMPKGEWTQCHHLVGELSVADDLDNPLYNKVFDSVSTDMPSSGLGCFVRKHGTTFQATEPVRIVKTSTGSNGVKYIHIEGALGRDRILVFDPKGSPGNIVSPPKTDMVFMPKGMSWVPLKEHVDPHTFHKTPSSYMDNVMNAMSSMQVKKAKVIDAGADQFVVDGYITPSRIEAIKKLAFTHVIDVEDAEILVKQAKENGSSSAYIVTPAQMELLQKQFEKTGEEDKKKDSKPKEKKPSAAPMQEQPNEEEQAMNDQATMQQQAHEQAQAEAASQPSPADLAAAEMQYMLQLEQQKLQEKQQLLMQLTQRTNEIAGGAPVAPTVQTQMMGAPPMQGTPSIGQMGQDQMQGMDPSMQEAAQQGMPQDMSPGMPQGVPQNAMNMDPNTQGMQQGIDPSMMGADPNMMGMDPGMQQQQMPPMMSDSGLSMSDIQDQISPQFLDMAGQLNSADVFDAAAISSLANSAALKELVGQYMPNLEQAIDNLGRVMLSLWMKETELKSDVGAETFTKLEDNLRNVFKNMGTLVLQLNQNAQVMKSPGGMF